jgi:hypothetical protein
MGILEDCPSENFRLTWRNRCRIFLPLDRGRPEKEGLP